MHNITQPHFHDGPFVSDIFLISIQLMRIYEDKWKSHRSERWVCDGSDDIHVFYQYCARKMRYERKYAKQDTQQQKQNWVREGGMKMVFIYFISTTKKNLDMKECATILPSPLVAPFPRSIHSSYQTRLHRIFCCILAEAGFVVGTTYHPLI